MGIPKSKHDGPVVNLTKMLSQLSNSFHPLWSESIRKNKPEILIKG